MGWIVGVGVVLIYFAIHKCAEALTDIRLTLKNVDQKLFELQTTAATGNEHTDTMLMELNSISDVVTTFRQQYCPTAAEIEDRRYR